MKGKFEIGSVHRGSRPEEVEMAPVDTTVHPTANLNPYTLTNNNPSKYPNHSLDHYHSIPRDRCEVNIGCLQVLW